MVTEFDPPIGVAETIAPGIRRIVAPNPSPMTFRGTNSYLVGDGSGVALIDPGPADPSHLAAILGALGPSQQITHIFVTHAHLDHSSLCGAMAAETGAPVLAFGPADAGRSDMMAELVEDGLTGGGEGIDRGFAPDIVLKDTETVSGDGWQIEALHTPGHMGNHLSFAMDDICFTGDHVMGWASSLVSPPDGDLTDFMASCRKLQTRDWHRFLPGHGAPIDAPADRLNWLIAHRQGREAEILTALQDAAGSPEDLAARIYTDIPAALHPAATRNVLAHLIDLTGRAIVTPRDRIGPKAIFEHR